jgi:ABC-2 type transport system ATP-binding protein
MSLVSLRGGVKKYPGFILGPIDLDLEEGRSYGLLGRNGAGKTTLLNCVSLQSRLDAGELALAGKPVRWNDRGFKCHTAFAGGAAQFYGELSITETGRLYSEIYPNWNWDLWKYYLGASSLDPNKKVSDLSAGMRVKLSLLVAMSRNSSLLLLDEPTSGLDPESRDELCQILKRWQKERGFALVVSSHLFEDIERVSDTILIIRQGKLSLERGIAASHESVRDLYYAAKD